MWSVTNNTMYAAGSSWDRDKDGVHEWIVAVKATFDIRPGGDVVISGESKSIALLAP